MKSYTSIRLFSFVLVVATLGLLSSCEQEYFQPNTSAQPGGGTVSTYKAYTLSDSGPGEVYGRIVFYKYSSTVTLVQIGLYNTDSTASYQAAIYSGPIVSGSNTVSKILDAVNGKSGAFLSAKYVTISDDTFFDNITSYDANVKVMVGSTAVAGGDIGANADPVAEQD